MKPALPAAFERLLATFFATPGHTSPEVRKAVLAQAGDPEAPAPSVPEPLRDYAEKVSLDATRVTDDDMTGLRAAGYDDDAIFEVTLAAALGAGATRMERGLAALRESK